jgi:DNA (cytosine-5)-methyltransferase 1
MIAFPDGSVRYLTIREAARIQTFPDYYIFPTSWTESMRQIGNAVPVLLAEKLSREIFRNLDKRRELASILEKGGENGKT